MILNKSYEIYKKTQNGNIIKMNKEIAPVKTGAFLWQKGKANVKDIHNGYNYNTICIYHLSRVELFLSSHFQLR